MDGGGGGARPCMIYNVEAISAFSLSLSLFTHMFDNKERTGVFERFGCIVGGSLLGGFFFSIFRGCMCLWYGE